VFELLYNTFCNYHKNMFSKNNLNVVYTQTIHRDNMLERYQLHWKEIAFKIAV
jgi:hypothetical protein